MLRLPDDLARFRSEVMSFCAENLPADIALKARLNLHLEKADYVRWQQILRKAGWYCGHWPVECSGAGWSPLQRYVFEQALAEAGAPWMLPFGPAYVGPVIVEYGTPEQKERFLPGILDSTTFWCQGYSEPEAGSDLAGLKTEAVRKGDVYIVNGQKLWTSYAQWADMMFCLVRTSIESRPQSGISFLLVDMKQPGVTVRPITTMDERQHVNEVFLRDAVVPVENLIGVEGRGWEVAKFLLATERLIVAETGKARRLLNQVQGLAEQFEVDGAPIGRDPSFAAAVTEAEIALETLEAFCARQLKGVAHGKVLGYEASLMKIRGSELLQKLTGLAMTIASRAGFRLPPENAGSEAEAELAGCLREYLLQRAATIYGGSNEIQRNIVSKAHFGF